LRKAKEHAVSGPGWTLLLSGPGRGHSTFKRALMEDLKEARDVRIICAYFVPTWRLRRALARVVKRGGRVQLLLAGKSDVEVVRLASRHLYERLLRAGIEIYEYQPQILHAKLLIIDNAVYVGSSNLDARSLSLNYELMIRMDDASTARQAAEIFAGDLAHSQCVVPRKWRGFWTRLVEKVSHFLVARVDPFLANFQLKRHARKAKVTK